MDVPHERCAGQATAEVIIAETGGDMSRFATAKHLASWAGVCPGHHESAGRTKNTKVRPPGRTTTGELTRNGAPDVN